MKIRSLIPLLFVAMAVSACSSSAGPFVTNISSDGRGGIVVEKCMVKEDDLCRIEEDLLHQISQTPAKTLVGIQAKARTVGLYFIDYLNSVDPDEDAPEIVLVASLMQDISNFTPEGSV